MIQYVLDTNAVIAILDSRSERLISRVRTCPSGSLALSALVVHELYYGAYKSQRITANLETVRLFLADIDVLDFTSGDAQNAGDIRAELARKGTPIGHYDNLIAGQVRERNLTLITNNTREFKRVEGLKVEDWTL